MSSDVDVGWDQLVEILAILHNKQPNFELMH